jgi:hypothetical protein
MRKKTKIGELVKAPVKTKFDTATEDFQDAINRANEMERRRTRPYGQWVDELTPRRAASTPVESASLGGMFGS